ncbi:MAG: LuxR C-terminal-related transcriptional regulator [Steroidobacteraceae bacterium]
MPGGRRTEALPTVHCRPAGRVVMDAWSPEDRLRLVDELSACSRFTQVADHLLAPLADTLAASSAVLVEFAEQPGQGLGVGRRSYLGTQPWSVDAYAERYFRADPLIRCDLGPTDAAHAAAPRIGTLPITEECRNSEYYRRFLQPSDIAHVLGITVPVPAVFGRRLLCLGFHRRHRDAPFDARVVQRLGQMAPLVQLVLSGLAAHDALPVCRAVLERCTQAHPRFGYVVFDEDLLVLHTGGGAAEDLGLTAGGAASVCGEGLLGELRQRLIAAPPTPGGAAARFALTRPCGSAPVEVEVQSVLADGGQRVIATTSVQGPADGMRTQYGFTSRELDVARRVCAGLSNARIGQELGIALRTVENHLRAVYAKAGVTSRTQLAALLLR